MLERISRSYVRNGTMSNGDDGHDDNEYFSLNSEPTLKSVTVEKKTSSN